MSTAQKQEELPIPPRPSHDPDDRIERLQHAADQLAPHLSSEDSRVQDHARRQLSRLRAKAVEISEELAAKASRDSIADLQRRESEEALKRTLASRSTQIRNWERRRAAQQENRS